MKKLIMLFFLSFLLLVSQAKADTVITSCPYQIIYSGKYYLDRNVLSTSWFDSWCIRISTSDVELDLMGYKTGRNMSSYWTASAGIDIQPGLHNITVINGTLISYGGTFEINNFGVWIQYNCKNITIKNIYIDSAYNGFRISGYTANEDIIFAENILINSSSEGIYATSLINSSFINITFIRGTKAIITSSSKYNVFKKSSFGSGTVDYYNTNCTLLCESTFGTVTEYGVSYNNTWTIGTCPTIWCPIISPPVTTTTTFPIIVGVCKVCDPVAISEKGLSYYWIAGECLFSNLILCNSTLIMVFFFIGLFAYLYVKFKFK